MDVLVRSPRLLATIGLPFAGKSTLSRQVANALPAELVAVDAMLPAQRSADDDRRVWLQRHHLALEAIRAGLARGNFVVFDAVNHTRHQRDRLRRLATTAGVGVRFLWLDVPPETARRRLLRNRLAPERPDVRDADFARLAKEFEPPDGERDVLVYDGVVPLTRWADDLVDALLIAEDGTSDGGLAFRRC